MHFIEKINKIVIKWLAMSIKGGLISESILNLVPLPTKGAELLPWAEDLNKLVTVKDGKFHSGLII